MRWSKEKAWAWYRSRPWIRGCNYMSADCANRVIKPDGTVYNFTKSTKELIEL